MLAVVAVAVWRELADATERMFKAGKFLPELTWGSCRKPRSRAQLASIEAVWTENGTNKIQLALEPR